jgi:hypothetical protein
MAPWLTADPCIVRVPTPQRKARALRLAEAAGAFTRQGGPCYAFPAKEHNPKERVMAEVEVGTVNKYFDKIGVGMIQVTQGELSVGDKIHIKGNATDLTTTIGSIQVQRQPVQTAKTGEEAGIKLDSKVKQKDKVFKVTD